MVSDKCMACACRAVVDNIPARLEGNLWWRVEATGDRRYGNVPSRNLSLLSLEKGEQGRRMVVSSARLGMRSSVKDSQTVLCLVGMILLAKSMDVIDEVAV